MTCSPPALWYPSPKDLRGGPLTAPSLPGLLQGGPTVRVVPGPLPASHARPTLTAARPAEAPQAHGTRCAPAWPRHTQPSAREGRPWFGAGQRGGGAGRPRPSGPQLGPQCSGRRGPGGRASGNKSYSASGRPHVAQVSRAPCMRLTCSDRAPKVYAWEARRCPWSLCPTALDCEALRQVEAMLSCQQK